MCSLKRVVSGKRLSIHPKSPVVSTVLLPAMETVPFSISLRAEWGAVQVSGLVVFVDTDDYGRTVGRELVGRHFEVIGGGHVLVNAAGQVESGTVARAEEVATVGGAQLRGGRASQMGANAHRDEEFGLAGAVFVLSVRRGKAGALGVGIGQQLVVGLAFERLDLLGRTVQYPHRLATPFDGTQLARRDAADVHFDRSAGRASFGGRGEG